MYMNTCNYQMVACGIYIGSNDPDFTWVVGLFCSGSHGTMRQVEGWLAILSNIAVTTSDV